MASTRGAASVRRVAEIEQAFSAFVCLADSFWRSFVSASNA
jgi:hypothetical protein